MFSIRKLNIKKKLMTIIMVASTTAVLLAGSIFISFSVYSHRQDLAYELTGLAGVIGNNCKVILEFNIPEDARKVLSTLEAKKSIVFACIFTADGKILTSYGHHQSGDVVPPADTQEDGFVFANNFLHVFHHVRVNEEVVGTVYLKDDLRNIYHHMIRDITALITIMTIAIIIAYIMSAGLQRMISRPILSLADIATTVSEKKDYTIRAKKESEDEVGKLIDSFNDMLSQIQHRDDALRQSESRFRAAFDSANDCVLVWDRDYNYLYANQAAIDHVGTTADMVIGKNIRDGLGNVPDFMHLWMDRIDHVFETGNMLRVQDETTMQESQYFTDSILSPIHDTGGAVAAVCVVYRDITELKLAEGKVKASLKEKNVLLSEIHHRVKNNMQVITSLLKLQADKIKDKQYADIFKESQARIKSMSLVHESLYQSGDFAEIDFKGYTRSLITSLFRTYGTNPSQIKLKIDIEDVSLGLERAIPCGLIINELISNSLKYAFPENRDGEIRVALYSINEEEVVLEVSDNGIGMPEELDIGNTESMGLFLVTILSEDQLDGSIELKIKKGTTFQIKFKKYVPKSRDIDQ